MGPLSWLRIVAACALCGPWGTHEAAEITRIASGPEENKSFDVDFTVRFERSTRRGKITREGPSGDAVVDLTELQYQQTTSRIVPRLAVGLYRDLEIHAELPYILSDEHLWRLAGPTSPSASSILNNAVDVNDAPCPGTCPIFAVGNPTAVNHRGAGDLTLGLAWGILSERRDDTKPFWIVGLDVTMPTATRYDPTTAIPLQGSSARAPVGEKIWAYDVYTALSKRVGAFDPYLKAHARLSSRSGSTYSNCEHAAEPALAALPGGWMNQDAAANCGNSIWRDEAGARPPTVLGLLFGTEVVAHEDARDGQRVAVDLRLGADYLSDARWFNELTDATGKLLETQGYLAVSGLAGFYVRASRRFLLRASATLTHDFPHYLTGEPLGRGAAGAEVVGTPDYNPNFDWRYDLPGRRFRISDTNVFGFQVGATGYF